MLHIYEADAALSDFRLAALGTRLRAAGVGLPDDGLSVTTLYLVQGENGPLSGENEGRLRELLGGARPFAAAAGERFVVPRLGTLSAWSSKATDIARVCDLGVTRIERGRCLRGLPAGPLPEAACALLLDRMTESLLDGAEALPGVFAVPEPRPLRFVPLAAEGSSALARANRDWGLALSEEEIAYLAQHYAEAGRDPTDAELMMFAQINSEHCRHKIFNARYTVDGAEQPHSLFDMIRMTHAATPEGVLSAYKDNAAVVAGPQALRFFRAADNRWQGVEEPVHLLMKVETHNHPTGISPDPGAATGAGGEIRDEAATGRGGRPKAGLCGFSVSHLRIHDLPQPWEYPDSRPANMASPLQIMLEAPIGAANYNNEFGRPNLAGYFRAFEQITPDGRRRGYHKPIMIAGGYGNIRNSHVEKLSVVEGAALVVLGGPAMLIGLGGGAASSQATGAGDIALDFASVQRANPELERRCQEVIDACWAAGEANPILSIHDVGAGGLSNAFPEIVDADGRGGHFYLRDVHCADPSLSPMEIWCNESQERYVLAVAPDDLPRLTAFCERERCPMAVVGTATAQAVLRVEAPDGEAAVDMPMPVLLGKAPRMHRTTERRPSRTQPLAVADIDFAEAAHRVLAHPSVAAKDFLITIGDRSVGGLTVRDQMVGPWQVPVADCAITATGFESASGEAMSMGERAPLAILDAAASARMAVAEALTNLASAAPAAITDVRLSANWMAACGEGDEDARLFDAVRAVGAEFCPALGLAIPVGKDSLSMRSVWSEAGEQRTQSAPVSLIVSAFAPVPDVRVHVTPQLQPEAGTQLLLVDLGGERNRLGGSILAQVFDGLGETPPDIDDPAPLRHAFEVLCRLIREGRILACHDRSDGGLFATVAEMAFAGQCGARLQLDGLGDDPLAAAFSEEAGWVLQVREVEVSQVVDAFRGIPVHDIGTATEEAELQVRHGTRQLFAEATETLHKHWAQTTHHIARLRDNPDCADEEQAGRGTGEGLIVKAAFEAFPAITGTARPPVAILREQGVNGHVEMAWAFHAAGFEAVDLHMSEVLAEPDRLQRFHGLVACGGFSYGDVLGAGQGWARSILFHPQAREAFARFFTDESRFALGVCNGCQMLAALKDIIPGAEHWPQLTRNRSEVFEARWSQVAIPESRSLFFDGMAGSLLPVAVAHGEGRMTFAEGALAAARAEQQIALHYAEANGSPAQSYPANPNGSPDGVTGICNTDGRITILMPHPERTVAGTTGSWWPTGRQDYRPWMRMFANALRWVG